jgi:hypothetical protein
MRQLDAMGCNAPPSSGGILTAGPLFFLYFFFLLLFDAEVEADDVDSADDCEVICEHIESVSLNEVASL